MTTLDLLDRAHTLLAKSALPKSQYDPISELLIRAKAELVAEEMKRPELKEQSHCRTFLLVNAMRILDKPNTIWLIKDLLERMQINAADAGTLTTLIENRLEDYDGGEL